MAVSSAVSGSRNERKTFVTTKEDIEQNTADIPAVIQRPVLQYIDTTVDVPVAKAPQEHHEDCKTMYNEIKMDKKMRSAWLRTESNKQNVFDSEGRSDLRFRIQYKTVCRIMRCVTLTTPSKTVVRRRNSRQNEATNRSSCHGRSWKRPSQR